LNARCGRTALRASLALASALALLGCATRSIPRVAAPPRPPRAASLEEVLEAYDGYCKGLATLGASGDLDVKDLRAGKERKLGVRLAAARGGRLYLKGTFLFVTAIEIVADGARFWFQVPSRKTVWTGASEQAPAAEGDDHAPYYALRPKDVTAALLPEPLTPSHGEFVTLDADSDSFALTLADVDFRGRGVARRRVVLERERLRPLSTRSYDARGDLVSETTLDDYRDGAPHRLLIRRPGEGYVADFALDTVEVNAAVPERAFVPRTPEGYKLIEVGKP
jgi:outer membrane lipoprotein-sorting protein